MPLPAPSTREISTHAPLARCDHANTSFPHLYADFNSRTSCEVRLRVTFVAASEDISTHAPLARCDVCFQTTSCHASDFNSRTSCEVRQNSISIFLRASRFQLTHLLRGATFPFTSLTSAHLNFNSRTSCEVRRGAAEKWNNDKISTHAPLARCDAVAAGLRKA